MGRSGRYLHSRGLLGRRHVYGVNSESLIFWVYKYHKQIQTYRAHKGENIRLLPRVQALLGVVLLNLNDRGASKKTNKRYL